MKLLATMMQSFPFCVDGDVEKKTEKLVSQAALQTLEDKMLIENEGNCKV
jgi:hypothetical protein